MEKTLFNTRMKYPISIYEGHRTATMLEQGVVAVAEMALLARYLVLPVVPSQWSLDQDERIALCHLGIALELKEKPSVDVKNQEVSFYLLLNVLLLIATRKNVITCALV